MHRVGVRRVAGGGSALKYALSIGARGRRGVAVAKSPAAGMSRQRSEESVGPVIAAS